MRAFPIPFAAAVAVFAVVPADAQSYQTGQSVYAAPTGGGKYWYSGCIVGTGRSNSSYQVECAGTTWWVSADRISTLPPPPYSDPMSPGQTVTPVITPSHAPAAGGGGTPSRVAVPPAASQATGQSGGYAAQMHRRIQQDHVDAAHAVLRNGKYSCYAGGRYTFSDLYITGPHSYRVEPGGSGSYSYANGALTFQSGPYAGAYSRMVDGHTIGVSARGNTNLGTQCGIEQ